MKEALAILGGTGKLGKGLVTRWARAGRPIVVGSRDAEKGRMAAGELRQKVPGSEIQGTSNRDAAESAGIIVSALPHQSHLEILAELGEALEGKLLIVTTIAWPPRLSGEPSAAEAVRERLGTTSQIVAAFQTVSARTLAREHSEPEDVLVFSDDEPARRESCALVDETGLRGIDAGPLQGARAAEAMTGILLAINRRYRVPFSGIRITGLGSS
ncbi:MAG TPA: NAD(P)-binding domain-containing protein [Vicinamibacteria bacterium]|nr:NAD(P)-binding domain-containing protein [Vicinamibacteria bacterium]